MEKPIAYNYVKAEEEIKRLKEKVANLEIRCRIAEENKPEWIPVGERLPDDMERVLVFVKDPLGLLFHQIYKSYIGIYMGDSKWGVWTGDDGMMLIDQNDIYAWMPLPEPYREESEVGE